MTGNEDETISQRLRQFGRAITVMEFAGVLHVSKQVVYDLIHRGQVPYYKFATAIRFDPIKLAVWLDESEYKVVVHHRPRKRR